MMPPRCAVCHRRPRDVPSGWGSRYSHYTLIQVGPRRPSRRTGHPHGAVWFCWRHAWQGYYEKLTGRRWRRPKPPPTA